LLNLRRALPTFRRPASACGFGRLFGQTSQSVVAGPHSPSGDALDKTLREKQFELVNIQEKVGITFIMVTHDQEDAMTVSTRMSVMEQGHIRQVGTPREIY